MESVIWSLASVVVLIPVLYLLPIGMTKKGKAIIIFLSASIAFFSLLIRNSFNLPLTIVFIFTIIFFAAYILNQRLASLIFTINKKQDFEKDSWPVTNSPLSQYSLEEMDLRDEEPLNVTSFYETDSEPNRETLEEIANMEAELSIQSTDQDIDFLLHREPDENNVSELLLEEITDSEDESMKPNELIEKYEIDWSLLETEKNFNSSEEKVSAGGN